MNLQELISENPQVSITVKGEDLADFARTVADEAAEAVLQRQDEKLYTRAEIIEKLGVSEATIWRWAKSGILTSRRIGNRVYFPENSIKDLIKNGR